MNINKTQKANITTEKNSNIALSITSPSANANANTNANANVSANSNNFNSNQSNQSTSLSSNNTVNNIVKGILMKQELENKKQSSKLNPVVSLKDKEINVGVKKYTSSGKLPTEKVIKHIKNNSNSNATNSSISANVNVNASANNSNPILSNQKNDQVGKTKLSGFAKKKV